MSGVAIKLQMCTQPIKAAIIRNRVCVWQYAKKTGICGLRVQLQKYIRNRCLHWILCVFTPPQHKCNQVTDMYETIRPLWGDVAECLVRTNCLVGRKLASFCSGAKATLVRLHKNTSYKEVLDLMTSTGRLLGNPY